MPRALGEEEFWMTPRCKLTSLHPDWSTRLTVFCKAGEYASTASRKPWDGHSDCIAAKTILWYFGSLDSFLTMLLLVNHSSKARTFCFLSYFLLCLIILSKKKQFCFTFDFTLSFCFNSFFSPAFAALAAAALRVEDWHRMRQISSQKMKKRLSLSLVTKVVKTIRLP